MTSLLAPHPSRCPAPCHPVYSEHPHAPTRGAPHACEISWVIVALTTQFLLSLPISPRPPAVIPGVHMMVHMSLSPLTQPPGPCNPLFSLPWLTHACCPLRTRCCTGPYRPPIVHTMLPKVPIARPLLNPRHPLPVVPGVYTMLPKVPIAGPLLNPRHPLPVVPGVYTMVPKVPIARPLLDPRHPLPVVPGVYTMVHRSFGDGATGATGWLAPRRCSSSKLTTSAPCARAAASASTASAPSPGSPGGPQTTTSRSAARAAAGAPSIAAARLGSRVRATNAAAGAASASTAARPSTLTASKSGTDTELCRVQACSWTAARAHTIAHACLRMCMCVCFAHF
eukprot:366004-Chlamydomonas_euryale.AAC.5